jgi:aminopeptidase N
MNSPQTKYLKEYTPSHFDIEHIDLYFNLNETHTDVRAIIKVERVKDMNNKQKALPLYGEDLKLISITMDGAELHPGDYRLTSEVLIINNVKTSFVLNIQTRIKPHENTSLSGLYVSNDIFCTQCEAEGFRRITYFLDRPDVMSPYTCTIEADKKKYPVLLSNGNLIQSGEFDNGRHWVTWEDPFPKPSYLFAMVAGDLNFIENTIHTKSEKKVRVRIYAEKENIDRCEFAMTSLINAIFWDEDKFKLEYDLDMYMVVAINDFNMGAMENKGLNIFNAKCILADPKTATDDDYANIERVIAHEYFHNWTGNRITLKNWFQLCLKEGLTVFRDQLYSEDVSASRVLKRIKDVQTLRLHQFPEDDGPTAHPVRPDHYIEMNNFYTSTVYEKGAAVIRMLYRLLGEDFFEGMDYYFDQYDGQAITVENFLTVMADAGEMELDQFKLWYTQAGTPRVTVRREYFPEQCIYKLTFEQVSPPTPGQLEKEPLLIPIDMALLDKNGEHVTLQHRNDKKKSETLILQMTDREQTFEFIHIYEEPIPSLFRDFSACVKVSMDYTIEERLFLMTHDTDDFNRWDQNRQIFLELIFQMIHAYHNSEPVDVPSRFLDACERIMTPPIDDKILLAEMLKMPTAHEIAHYCSDKSQVVDPDAIHYARKNLKETIAEKLSSLFIALYEDNNIQAEYEYDPGEVARRSIKNIALDYLVCLKGHNSLDLALRQFKESDNMTDTFSALQSLSHADHDAFQEACNLFYEQWKHDPLVLDKWFFVQAVSQLDNTLSNVKKLLNHHAFTLKNPNRVRALLGSFINNNHYHFHCATGQAYELLGDFVLELDKINPQIASRMVAAFNHWRKYDENRQALMQNQLNRILNHDQLSKDVYEIVSSAIQSLN